MNCILVGQSGIGDFHTNVSEVLIQTWQDSYRKSPSTRYGSGGSAENSNELDNNDTKEYESSPLPHRLPSVIGFKTYFAVEPLINCHCEHVEG